MNQHHPVLLEEVLNMATTMDQPPQTFLDGTFGRGGHCRALLNKFPELKVVALDQDQAAMNYAEQEFAKEISSGQMLLVHENFINIDELSGHWHQFLSGKNFDLILIDLGVSSPQLDVSERGFSFYADGPLDMRMNQQQDLTAAEIINNWEAQELSDLFYKLGEIKFPNKVVRAIVENRESKKILSTLELSTLIEKVCGWRKKGKHPATQYFLALRLYVNSELEVIEKALPKLVNLLNPGGRLLVISFHSTEDRIVKYGLRELKSEGSIINKKVIQAKFEDVKSNPRARSAKLRGFQKGVAHES